MNKEYDMVVETIFKQLDHVIKEQKIKFTENQAAFIVYAIGELTVIRNETEKNAGIEKALLGFDCALLGLTKSLQNNLQEC